MIRRSCRADEGQSLPLYIWLTGILLFAALAFFAFAQAASSRNTAQSAADAAALAAAQEARDEVHEQLGLAIGEEEDWLDWLDGELPQVDTGAAARELAAANGATVVGGPALTEVGGFLGYRVDVQSQETVGRTVIPGTESMQAEASATAVVEPRCTFDLDADPEQPVELDCDGELLTIDPEDFDPEDLPGPSDMFSVHLAE
ncbi:pilus assembly protein TadG-related protein [Streptomyces sp. MJP52]|uniref:pilus assembly protein TadG-related protein n=1 Tax=Streptomyces sp. MJP52 TaxID=2940555 RepID=UPI002473638C|nr:pilus assembly protein TadG-related protein [Streptomyces sp. MJP52]MDH6225291.1 hypothetical protein [Streptomyces sp. MJP52]